MPTQLLCHLQLSKRRQRKPPLILKFGTLIKKTVMSHLSVSLLSIQQDATTHKQLRSSGSCQGKALPKGIINKLLVKPIAFLQHEHHVRIWSPGSAPRLDELPGCRWQVEADYEGAVADVQALLGHRCGHQHIGGARLEAIQGVCLLLGD